MDTQVMDLESLRPVIQTMASRLAYERNINGRGLFTEDLEQEGMLAAWLALPKATCKTYAISRARWAMRDAVRYWIGLSGKSIEGRGFIDAKMVSADDPVFESVAMDQLAKLADADASKPLELRQCVQEWLESLDGIERRVMEDLIEHGLKQKEIADHLRIDLGTVERRIRNARRDLLSRLEVTQ